MPLFCGVAQCFPLCDIHHLVVIYKKTRFAIFSGIYEVELKFMTNLRNNKEQKHTSGLFGSFLFKNLEIEPYANSVEVEGVAMYAFIIPKTSHVCLSSTGGLKRTRTLPCFVWQSE